MSAPNAGVGLIEEMMNFGVVYRLGDDHAAGIQTTRYPANCSLGFQPLPSLSFFLCNDHGESGIARPCVERQSSALVADEVPDKYVRLDSADGDTPARVKLHLRFRCIPVVVASGGNWCWPTPRALTTH